MQEPAISTKMLQWSSRRRTRQVARRPGAPVVGRRDTEQQQRGQHEDRGTDRVRARRQRDSTIRPASVSGRMPRCSQPRRWGLTSASVGTRGGGDVRMTCTPGHLRGRPRRLHLPPSRYPHTLTTKRPATGRPQPVVRRAGGVRPGRRCRAAPARRVRGTVGAGHERWPRLARGGGVPRARGAVPGHLLGAAELPDRDGRHAAGVVPRRLGVQRRVVLAVVADQQPARAAPRGAAAAWLLVGDDGQHDPSLYAKAARNLPGRVAAVASGSSAAPSRWPGTAPGADAASPGESGPPFVTGPDGARCVPGRAAAASWPDTSGAAHHRLRAPGRRTLRRQGAWVRWGRR